MWVVIAETEVCGLVVKVLLVGSVYDTFLMVTRKGTVDLLFSQIIVAGDIIICLAFTLHRQRV